MDGFNLPVSIVPEASCPTTSCGVDINAECPSELAVRNHNGHTIGCKSACTAFNTPQDCCTGEYNSPTVCQHSKYSNFFEEKCPQAYSYAYDDKTSTFTCPTGPNYKVTFCP